MAVLTVGRNDPCPCKSGKKFKKCCLLAKQPKQPVSTLFGVQQRAGHLAEILREPAPAPKQVPPGVVEDGTERHIEGTAEHPFYVYGKGWTPMGQLQPGDWIRTDNGWVEVGGVEDTGRVETVYNLAVADHHTYFVGTPEWGFGVWAHNANGICFEVKPHEGKLTLFEVGKSEPVMWDPRSGKTGPRTFASQQEAANALETLGAKTTPGKPIITTPGKLNPDDIAATLKGINDPTAKRIAISEYLEALKGQREVLGKPLASKMGMTTDGGIVFFGPTGGRASPVLPSGEINRNVILVTREGKVYQMTLEGFGPYNQSKEIPFIPVNLQRGRAIEIPH
jgi:hypothetical protein